MSKKRSKQHGGKRANAGRKAKDNKKEVLSMRVDPENKEAIRELVRNYKPKKG